MQQHLLTTLLIGVSLLSGCAGVKTYSDTPTKNLDIHTRTDSGSFLSSTRASMDVFSVDSDCQTTYLGTVAFDADSRSVGLPAGRPSYLVFRFESSSFLANSRGTTHYDTLFTPLPDSRYDVDVRYLDGIYSVEIRERAAGDASTRRIAPMELEECRRT